ncbi:MAG: signal peptidase I [Clostridiales bacterium]|nr:signal peptidase I [Clostridiales bacterium]
MNRVILEYWVDLRNENKETRHILYDFVDALRLSVIALFLFFAFCVRFIGISGTSMLPNLRDNDRVVLSAVNFSINRGDIVVVTMPWVDDVPIVKRVIAVGGDRVDIDFETGAVRVNGERLNETYINTPTNLSYDVRFPVTVKEGELFLLGDNRNNSLDSRSREIGMVDENYVEGKVIIRLFPEFKIFKTEKM